MELTFIVLIWLTAVVFTLASFVEEWRKVVFFPLMAAMLWNATALLMVQVHYVGMGSQNIIIYDHELGDWSGEVGVVWLLHGIGMLMFCYAIYNGFLIARDEIKMLESGESIMTESVLK